jgi:hypothetical protein
VALPSPAAQLLRTALRYRFGYAGVAAARYLTRRRRGGSTHALRQVYAGWHDNRLENRIAALRVWRAWGSVALPPRK